MGNQENEQMNAAKIHCLKTWPEQFEAILSGNKTHEYRLNDRDFQVGDVLALQEFSPESGYTGRNHAVTVSYVGKDGFGIPKGYAVLSIKPLEEICECMICCKGEHAGECYKCAGWGDHVDSGDNCEHCDGSGICPKCRGRSRDVEAGNL